MINMPSVQAIWLLITELINLDTRGLFAVFLYLLHSFNENNGSSTFFFDLLHGQAWSCWQSRYKMALSWLIDRGRKYINMYSELMQQAAFLCWYLIRAHELWLLIQRFVTDTMRFLIRSGFHSQCSDDQIMVSRHKKLRSGSFPRSCLELLISTIILHP